MRRRGSLVAVGSMAVALALANVPTATDALESWSTPVAVSPASFVFNSLVGSDSAGAVTVAWQIPTGFLDAGVWVRHRSPKGKWGKAENVDPLANRWLAMDEDAAGNVCLLYARWHRGNVPSATCAGPDGVFSPPTTLSAHTPYTDYRLVVDDHDAWTASWTQSDSAGRRRIAVTRRVSGVWEPPVLVSGRGQVVSDYDLDTSPQGVVTLTWASRPRHHPQAPFRIHARILRGGTTWGPTTTLSGPGSPTPDVASGLGERADVVWISTHDGVQRLQTRTHTSAGWGSTHTLVTSRRGQSRIWAAEIATGGQATSVVTWERIPTDTVRGGIYALLRHHGRWGTPRAVSPARGRSDPPALEVSHTGSVWVFWQWKRSQFVNADGWTLQTRVYQPGGGWSALRDVSTANVGDMFPASIALLPSDLPAVTWVSSLPKLEGWRAMYSQAG
jgi:hypothetical protein